MAKLSELGDDDLVKLYIQIRDQKAVESKAWDVRETDLKEKLEKIGAVLNVRFKERGSTSTKTPFGTAFQDKVAYATVADRDAFFDYVFNNQARELIAASVAKDGVRQYIAAHNDIPPGVNWTEEVVVKVRRS